MRVHQQQQQLYTAEHCDVSRTSYAPLMGDDGERYIILGGGDCKEGPTVARALAVAGRPLSRSGKRWRIPSGSDGLRCRDSDGLSQLRDRTFAPPQTPPQNAVADVCPGQS